MQHVITIGMLLLLGGSATAQGKFYGGNGDGFAVSESSIILPVQLMAFNAVRQGNDAVITWKAAAEHLHMFVLERSEDGRHFYLLAELPATAGSSGAAVYRYIDRQRAGSAYYRLKWIEADGDVDYSKIVSVSFPGQASVQAFYDAGSHCFVIRKPATDVRLQLFGTDGVLLKDIRSAQPLFRLPAHDLAPGIYVIRTGSDVTGARHAIRVVKAH